MVQDFSGHTGGLCSSENQSLLQTFVAPCGLDASGAYPEPQLLVPFFPKDLICGSHTPESPCKMNQHAVNEGNQICFKSTLLLRNKVLK